MASNFSSPETEDMKEKKRAQYVHWLQYVHSYLLRVFSWKSSRIVTLECEPPYWTSLLLNGELKQTLRVPLTTHNLQWKYPPSSCGCKQAACVLAALGGHSAIVSAELASCFKQYCHLVVLTRFISLFSFCEYFCLYCVSKNSWNAAARTTELVSPRLQLTRRKNWSLYLNVISCVSGLSPGHSPSTEGRL